MARGIPVMGHVGLTPQSIHVLGGYKVQGRDGFERILQDAIAVADAGAFAVVLEKFLKLGPAYYTSCSYSDHWHWCLAACDGQILVIDDMLGCFCISAQVCEAICRAWRLPNLLLNTT